MEKEKTLLGNLLYRDNLPLKPINPYTDNHDWYKIDSAA